MQSYDFTNPDDFKACLRAFLAEHPTLRTASQAVAQATGLDELWLSTAGMVRFLIGHARSATSRPLTPNGPSRVYGSSPIRTTTTTSTLPGERIPYEPHHME